MQQLMKAKIQHKSSLRCCWLLDETPSCLKTKEILCIFWPPKLLLLTNQSGSFCHFDTKGVEKKNVFGAAKYGHQNIRKLNNERKKCQPLKMIE